MWSYLPRNWDDSRRRLKVCVASQIRQVPCIHVVLERFRKKFCGKGRYESLGQEEEGEAGTEANLTDDRQSVNQILGQVLVKVGVFLMISVTAVLVLRETSFDKNGSEADSLGGNYDRIQFWRDSPMILYLAAIEVLICGACAHTASTMYRRRRHALRHPRDYSAEEQRRYVQVHLEKDAGFEDRQLYGLGFRPSTDGLECLVVEVVRYGSLLEQWNNRVIPASPQELVEQALGDDVEAGSGGDNREFKAEGRASPIASTGQHAKVRSFNAIVAVNDVAADVGMMQLQLMKPKVTLWVRSEMSHASQIDESTFFADEPAQEVSQGAEQPTAFAAPGAQGASPAVAGPTSFGKTELEDSPWNETGFKSSISDNHGDEEHSSPHEVPNNPNPLCACVGLEDEEPQVLTRWTVCGIILGWVTLLPVLLTQPHENRPRQQLFRQFMLKPCLIVLPFWLNLWVLDCFGIVFGFKLFHPFWYFGTCHMLFPGILAWYLMQMQAADEQLVLQQRRERMEELGGALPMVAEDASPTLLKELISINPVASIWLGACAAIPLTVTSFLTPFETARAKLAQGYIHLIYGPMSVIQVCFLVVVWHVRFEDLPKLYIWGFGLVFSVPCFIVWCVCMMLASRYGRQDLRLVENQRLERGRAQQAEPQGDAATAGSSSDAATTPNGRVIVDCTEAHFREWALIYTA
eukprot:TRINITY_DN46023_c0_g1_i1.p1 TRINITY_DN46023_c0_g1~~TRINITY_DN46023_c0_g1_i1.p1  ORF type:complete len:691 (-),score=129.32 TRINITY_DN46023_c0_g1_i1:166-2238(-)